jgi:DNA-directed RNA polymerase subunit E'/Rpb7
MATVIIKKPKKTLAEFGKIDKTIYGVYLKSVLERKVCLNITEIGKSVKQNLEMKLEMQLGGKCVYEGYIKPKTVEIRSYSSGLVNGNNVEFYVTFDAMVCLPVEGMEIECVCKTITKAGIHAEVIDKEKNKPITMFIARDHHYLDSKFSNIKENDKIIARVIGIRYELNDDFICTIGKLV